MHSLIRRKFYTLRCTQLDAGLSALPLVTLQISTVLGMLTCPFWTDAAMTDEMRTLDAPIEYVFAMVSDLSLGKCAVSEDLAACIKYIGVCI